MKRIHTIALGLSAVALGIGGVAVAKGEMHRGGGMMKTLDTNADGTITRAEAQAGAAAMFTRMDVNKDGKLDQADREQGRAMMRDEMFRKLDTDSNGSISRAEFDAHHGPDGHGRDGGPMGGPGGHREHGGKPGHARKGGGMMAMAKMADTNNDGAISQAEFAAAAMKHFDMADANHDGKVTASEQQAAHEKMRAQMKAKWQADKPAGN